MSYPKNPKFGQQYTDDQGNLYCWMGAGASNGWQKAFRFKSAYSEQDCAELVQWLRENGVTRVTFTSGIQPGSAQPAVIFQNSVGSNRFEMAFSGDILVSDGSVLGIRVYGFPETETKE